MKLLKEVQLDMEARGIAYEHPNCEADETEMVTKYLYKKNMRTHNNRARFGFIYQFYA